MDLQYFCIFMYIWLLLKFVWVFFVESLPNMKNKNSQILTKRSPVAITVPSGTQRHHWGIGIPALYRGIHSDLRSRPEQSHHLPGALLSQWVQAVYRVSNGRSPPSILQKRRLHSLFMIVFGEYGKQICVTWRKLALWTSNLFSMRHLLNALSRYTGLRHPKG